MPVILHQHIGDDNILDFCVVKKWDRHHGTHIFITKNRCDILMFRIIAADLGDHKSTRIFPHGFFHDLHDLRRHLFLCVIVKYLRHPLAIADIDCPVDVKMI